MTITSEPVEQTINESINQTNNESVNQSNESSAPSTSDELSSTMTELRLDSESGNESNSESTKESIVRSTKLNANAPAFEPSPPLPTKPGHSDQCKGTNDKFDATNATHKPVDASEGCDYCHCECHKFRFCKLFKEHRRGGAARNGCQMIGRSNSSRLAPFYTSSFIVLYAPDQASEQSKENTNEPSKDQSNKQPTNQHSKYFKTLSPVSFLFAQEDRHLNHKLYRNDKKYRQWPVSTSFVGGKRDFYRESVFDCAMREFEEEVGSLLALAGVTLDELKIAILKQWNSNALLAHVQYGASVTLFAQIPSDMMNKFKSAVPLFVPKPMNITTYEHIQGVVVWSESRLLKQLEPLKSESSPPAFSDRDFAPFCGDVMLEVEKRGSSPHSSPSMKPHASPHMKAHSSPNMKAHSSPNMKPQSHSSPKMKAQSSPNMKPHSSPRTHPKSSSSPKLPPLASPKIQPHGSPKLQPLDGNKRSSRGQSSRRESNGQEASRTLSTSWRKVESASTAE